MTTRCPKCGRNNYGDVKKCSFCGSPLVFIPGEEETPEITEEDIQEKMSKIKVPRVRNPFFIGSGGAVTVIGLFLAVVIFLIAMLYVYDPGDVSPYYNSGLHYDVPGGEEYIFGKITKVRTDEETRWEGGVSHGYQGFTAYEINGDGKDNRAEAQEKESANVEPDTWIYSDEAFGEKDDRVLIKVVSEENQYGEIRAVYANKAPWGGSGWISAGWIYALPGILISLAGLTMLIFGIVGKKDTSMDRLMQEDAELRRQQIMLREAARKKMEAQKRSQQWSGQGQGLYGEETMPKEGTPPPTSPPDAAGPEVTAAGETVEQAPIQGVSQTVPTQQAPTGAPQPVPAQQQQSEPSPREGPPQQ
ncbi:MAG: zinc ribbon domain-containing protein [Thermoplasmatota archaeon]